MTDPYAKMTSAAHSGAFGLGSKATPTAEQVRAGNYKKGSLRLHGMPITIETPMFTPRTGKEDGKAWSIVCMANYGYINGVNGADGDAFDVYVGPVPESNLVVVVNQVKKDRSFDEHKAVLGFQDLESALNGYRNSYEHGWQGMGSYVVCTVKQFKAWLKSGDLSKPLVATDLIHDEVKPMTGTVIAWGEDHLPVDMTIGDVIYGLRRDDADRLLLDSATMADLTEFLSDGTMLDAMVIEYAQFQRKANQLLRVMQAAGATVKPEAVEVSQPFKNRGTTQVAMLFSMGDGQTVSVFFHNPDSTPNRLTVTDELISWKWVLNKKDITLVVAPERGQDINPRQVARRIMTLVDKNSAKFVKATGASADKAAQLDELKGQVESKTAEVTALDGEIAELLEKIETRDNLAAQQLAGQENQDNEPPQQIARADWEEATTQALAELLSADYNDAAGVLEAQAALADAQYLAGATPQAAAQAIHTAATGADDNKGQADMLGDDPSLRDSRTDLEKLTAALTAGNAMGALGVLDAIADVDALREVVLKAGFSLGASGSKDEILASVGRDLVRAAKAKTDGFGLRQPEQKPSVGSDVILEDYAEVAALGVATVLNVGSENVYFTKGDVRYMTKLLNTDDYEDKVGQEVDLSGVVDPSAQTPAAADPENEDMGDISPEGRLGTVKTAKGTKVVTGFKVIEARKLIISHETDGTPNPDYPSELQPRDRARATSQAWVQKTARDLDPDSLGRTTRADSGAPIVGTDRVVESGNGRAMAIREAYRIGQADEYRAWLIENADYFQISAKRVESMKAPILVRVRVSDVDRAEFAVEANQDDKLAMTATEKARSDAKRLDSAMMAKLVDGELGSSANRAFVLAFLQSLGDAEAAQYSTTDGNPTASLISRLQAALFAGAYSDDRLLELTADVSKPEIANIVSALNMAAPDFMRAKEFDLTGAEEAGEKVTDSLELSLDQEAVAAIINATNMLRKAKESGLGLDEFLRQGDMFGDIDPSVAAMAMFISKNNRSAKRLGTAFKAMAQFVESEAKRKQTAGLFDDAPASFADIVAAANAQLEKEFGEGVFSIEQNDLFSQPPVKEPAQQADDKDNAVKAAKDYLDSVIDGSANLGDPEGVMKELERIYSEFGEGELSGLFAEAADAFSQHALNATAEAF
ncbi:hypothetical protein [Pseudomonas gingeri]|uniref:defense against restriction DarA-related protein n=1 Tax=Pseudomonas gingeri TaxID=117681 RepID=UPI0015A3A3ED|nr:hypothetical protein [Pseudomonas gingeri]NWA11934.1 hypothetical protein [Pseudomonas gingeri]